MATEQQSREIVLRCACGLPYARIVNGVLIVTSRHHGETHQNVIALADLLRQAMSQQTTKTGPEQ